MVNRLVYRGDDVQKLYFILIAAVFVLSILFAVIIWRQTIKFEKKALAAKRAREEYLNQLKIEREEEERRIAEQQKQLEEQQSEELNESQNPDQEDNLNTGLW